MSAPFDDPLSMFAAEQQPVVKAPAPQTTAPTPVAEGEPVVFRQVDASKVVFKEKKAPKPTSSSESFGTSPAVAAPEVTESTKGLGFGVSLWENTTQAPSKTFDVLAEVQQQSTSSSSEGDGLFSSTARAPKPVVLAPSSSSSSSLSAGSSSSSSTSRVRVGGVQDDSKLDDLSTSTAFLERENDDELDYGLFGKSNAAASQKSTAATSLLSATTSSNSSIKPPLKARKDDFELESAETLEKMEALTLAKEKEPSIITPVAAPSSAAAKPATDIDMSALDLDSYIAQQSSNTGGGLFD